MAHRRRIRLTAVAPKHETLIPEAQKKEDDDASELSSRFAPLVASEVAVGGQHSLALTSDGRVMAAGNGQVFVSPFLVYIIHCR